MGLLSDLGPHECSRCHNARTAAQRRYEEQGLAPEEAKDRARTAICDIHQEETILRSKMDARNAKARERRARQ